MVRKEKGTRWESKAYRNRCRCAQLGEALEPRSGGCVTVEKAEQDTSGGSALSSLWQVIKATSFSHEAPEENKSFKDRPAVMVPWISPIWHTCALRGGTEIRACASLSSNTQLGEGQEVTAKADGPSNSATRRSCC